MEPVAEEATANLEGLAATVTAATVGAASEWPFARWAASALCIEEMQALLRALGTTAFYRRPAALLPPLLRLLRAQLLLLCVLALLCALCACLAVFFFALSVRLRRRMLRLSQSRSSVDRAPSPNVVGLFHPYCNAGGGGERVLWAAVRTIQEADPTALCVIYTGDRNASPAQILERAEKQFDLRPRRPVHFCYLRTRFLVEAWLYPAFTMVGQSAGSVTLAAEALLLRPPDLFLDTMGYAFTHWLARWCGCRVGCYVHYPTISTDMLEQAQRAASVLRRAKTLYYRLFAGVYGVAGQASELVMVNSSWTAANIAALWRTQPQVVFPPCPTTQLQSLPLQPRQNLIVSLAQFRPEKNQRLQLEAFAELLRKWPSTATAGQSSRRDSGPLTRSRSRGSLGGSAVELSEPPRLALIGSCRDDEDRARVAELRELSVALGIADRVEFMVGISNQELHEMLGMAKAGLHTMWCEHFGIGVVEFQAAGVIPVAHNSGGPKLDIVIEYNGERTGYLATTAQEYAESLFVLLTMPTDRLQRLQRNARAASQRFSDEEFHRRLSEALSLLLA